MNTLKNSLSRLFDFIIYGNVFIAFCAAMSTYSTEFIINSSYTLPASTNSSFILHRLSLSIFVGVATFFLYNLHKPVTYFLKKQFTDNQRFTRTKAFQGPLSILSVLAAIYCIYYFFQLKTASQCVLILMAFFSLGYVLPILGNGQRLRDIPYLKIFLIVLVWSVTTVGLPFLELNNNISTLPFLRLCMGRSCFIFALCIPFDIRDMDWDSRTNVKTIPLSIGVEKAKISAILALIISLSMCYLEKKIIMTNLTHDFKLIIVYTITAFIILKTHKNRSDYFFYIGVDGLILLQSLLLSSNIN